MDAGLTNLSTQYSWGVSNVDDFIISVAIFVRFCQGWPKGLPHLSYRRLFFLCPTSLRLVHVARRES